MATSTEVFKALSIEQVKQLAPSAFTEGVIKRASKTYIPINTPNIIKDLNTYNWKPIDAYEVRPKKEENKGFQKHFIKFRNSTFFVGTEDNIELIPELLLVNSYDARCALKLIMQFHRTASGQSVVVKSRELEEESVLLEESKTSRITHKGNQELHLIEAIDKNVHSALKWIDNLKSVKLNLQQQKQFAQECCRARWDYKYKLLEPKQLLSPWREEDESDDMWTIYNRIDEKLTNGGWTGTGGRAIKKLVDRNRELIVKSRLFHIAEDFYYQII